MKKLTLTTVAIGLFLLVLVVSAAVYLLVDERAPNVADLMPPARVELPENENALGRWQEAGRKFVEPGNWLDILHAQDGGELEGGKVIVWGSREIQDVLVQNAEALRLVDEGLALGKLQVPQSDRIMVGDGRGYLGHWRDLSWLLETRVYALSAAGMHREALDEALKIIRFGNIMQHGEGAGTEYVISLRIKKDCGYPAFSKALCPADVDAASLAEYSRQIASLIDSGDALANTLRREFLIMVNPTDGFGSGRLPDDDIGSLSPTTWDNLLFLPNATQNLFADVCRASIRNIPRRPDQYEVSEAARRFRQFEKSRLPHVVHRNSSGMTWIAGWGWCMLDDCLFLERLEDVALNRGIRLLIALKLYKMKHGGLPPSLDDLVPEFIEAVPEDPFDGKPFRYNPAKKAVYSVGEYGEDNEADEQRDIVIKIEF